MQQYLELLKVIKEKGTHKPPARQGMPGSLSLFGYQFRHDLQEGFPLLTTKKINFKSVVTELLWFLRGDTNIKYLIDNGCNIWNEDAYNYYLKKCKQNDIKQVVSFEDFILYVQQGSKTTQWPNDYKLGDCGFQYGKVWRDWQGIDRDSFFNSDNLVEEELHHGVFYKEESIDQIANVIKSLKETPESRRHIVTAIDPAHDTDLALYWCHAMFQFNCRPLTLKQRVDYMNEDRQRGRNVPYLYLSSEPWSKYDEKVQDDMDSLNAPKYYLDCQMYQRSADVFLGVPFNIASYSLLTHIIAKICNMVPGEFIHIFGDVHIYDDHMSAVNEQLSREPRELPELLFRLDPGLWNGITAKGLELSFEAFVPEDFMLKNYNPYPAIKAKLSTGLK